MSKANRNSPHRNNRVGAVNWSWQDPEKMLFS